MERKLVLIIGVFTDKTEVQKTPIKTRDLQANHQENPKTIKFRKG